MHITHIRSHKLTRIQALAYLHHITPTLTPAHISALLTAAFAHTRTRTHTLVCYDVELEICNVAN